MIRLRSLQSIIILLLVFLLLPGQVMGTVLCIGADGHVALETAWNGKCIDSLVSISFSTPRQQRAMMLVGASPCVDISLLTSNIDDRRLRSAPSSSLKLEAPVLVLVAFIISVYTEFPHIDFDIQPPPLASTLVALRTVVLLL